MKKFLPGLVLFGIVFTATLALQVGASALKSSAPVKTKNDLFESIYKTLEVTTITEKKIILSNLKNPIVIVNFWASWCIPCMEEMPSLVQLKKRFSNEELIILSLNTDENEQQKNIIKTMRKFNITNEFEVVADANTKIADQFKFTAIPVTIIYHKGKVVEYVNGPIDFNAAELNDKLKQWAKN